MIKKINQNRSFEIEDLIDFKAQIQEEKEFDSSRNNLSRSNENLFWFFVSILIIFLLARVFQLQVLQGAYYKEVSEKNRIRTVHVYAPRGLIRDSNNQILAKNQASFDIIFTPFYLPKESRELDQLLSKLNNITKINKDEFLNKISQANPRDRRVYLLKEDISHQEALLLMEEIDTIPGIELSKTTRRIYPFGKVFSHLIGYEGKITKEELENNQDYLFTDYIGKTGIEYSYEKFLRGNHGRELFEVNAKGEIKEEIDYEKPVPGNDLILNIDGQLQKKAYEILDRFLNENKKATGASLVAVDPRNGAVRAMVSLPSFDNNIFTGKIDQNIYQQLLKDPKKPLFNRSISGEFPPGSTFKPMIALAALEENIIKKDTVINCTGSINIGSWEFPDWKIHGLTDVRKAIAESCNVFFYAIGGGWNEINGLGADKLNRHAKLLGFGDYLGIDIPGESSGQAPDSIWKFKKFGEKWYKGDSYHSAIGQGFVTATPLQIANMTSTIANGGKLYRPQIIDKIIDTKNQIITDIKPEIIREGFVSDENLKTVQEGMYETVYSSEGSGRRMSNLKVKTAGKTGTAQFENNQKSHSWYIAYGPYENPQLATVVLFESGGEGYQWSVPATYELYQWYFDDKNKTTLDEYTDEDKNEDKN